MKYFIYDKFKLIATATAASALIYYFIGFPAHVSGPSMLPTLKNREPIFVLRTNNIKESDIVSVNMEDKDIVKRVFALYPTYIQFNEKTAKKSKNRIIGFLQVPKNKCFLLGDNRDISKDSRILGFVDVSKIEGKVIHFQK